MKHSEYLKIKLLLCLVSILHTYLHMWKFSTLHLLNWLHRKMRQLDLETSASSQHGGRQSFVNAATTSSNTQKPEWNVGAEGAGSEKAIPHSGLLHYDNKGWGGVICVNHEQTSIFHPNLFSNQWAMLLTIFQSVWPSFEKCKMVLGWMHISENSNCQVRELKLERKLCAGHTKYVISTRTSKNSKSRYDHPSLKYKD